MLFAFFTRKKIFDYNFRTQVLGKSADATTTTPFSSCRNDLDLLAADDRTRDGDVQRRVFEMVVDRCAAFGFVGGQAANVDGSTIAADASRERKDQPEVMQKIWAAKEEVARPVRQGA